MKQFIKVVAIAIFMFSASAANAQKIGHLDVDSLLKIWPSYQAVVDSLTAYQLGAQKQAQNLQLQYMAKAREIDSMKTKDTPLIAQLRATQLQQIADNYDAYVEYAAQEAQVIQAQLVDTLYKQLDAAISKVAKANGYGYILDSSKGGQVMYANTTDDVFLKVCAELKITPPKPKAPGTGTPK